MRRLLALVGTAAIAAGLASVAGVPVAALALREAFVTLVGVLVGVQGLRYLLERRAVAYRATETADPEERATSPTPGTDFDEELTAAATWSRAAVRDRAAIRDRLRETAVETMVVRGDCSRETAERLVEDGEWTTDPVAAGFLTPEGTAHAFPDRVRLLAQRESPFANAATRTVAAIDRLQAEGP
jgi:hypothetical protein